MNQEDNPDKEGVGKSQMEESQSGHKGPANSQQELKNSEQDNKRQDKRQRPGDSDSQRSLGDTKQPVKKKLKTINIQDDKEVNNQEENEGASESKEAEMYQHIKEAKSTDEQVFSIIILLKGVRKDFIA